MKRKNGFTLIELLSVIAILAIILLIAVPMVLGTIATSKDLTLTQSAKILWGQAEDCISMNTLAGATGLGCPLPTVHVTARYSGFKNTGTTGFQGGVDNTNWITLNTASTMQRFLVEFNAGASTISRVTVHSATTAGSVAAAGRVCYITSANGAGNCSTI